VQQRLSISDVTFRAISTQEIIQYWHTGEPADKAGAYAIAFIDIAD
jgi:septum formation protein